MARAHVGRQQLAPLLEHDSAQRRALRERQPLPQRFEHRLLFGEQPRQRLVQVVERRPAPARRRAPRPTSRARAAGRRTAGCRRARRSRAPRPASGLMPDRLKRASMNAANSSAGIFSSRMTGPAL